MSTSWLCTNASPTSFPPETRPATAPGTPFFSKTLATILVTAMEHSGVLGEGFQIVALPAAIEIARFLPIHADSQFKNRFSSKTVEINSPAIYSDGEVERR